MIPNGMLLAAKRICSAKSFQAFNYSIANTKAPSGLENIFKKSSLLPSLFIRTFESKAPLAQNENNTTATVIPNSDVFILKADSKKNIKGFLDYTAKSSPSFQKSYARELFRYFRRMRKYDKALMVSEWIQGHFEVSSSDHAVRLDLIAKVHGLAAAEKYFEDLPASEKDQKTYSSLLHCYVKEKNVEKSETLMEKIRSLGYDNRFNYIDMMALYKSTGEPGKVFNIVQTLKGNNISLNPVCYNIWLSACAETSDFNSIDNIVNEIEDIDNFESYWPVYCNLANIFIKMNQHEKARMCVEELESKFLDNQHGLHTNLISLYGHLNDKEGIYRVWESYKQKFSPKLFKYLGIHSSLVTMGDFEEAEKLFDEWYSANGSKNFRHACMFIKSYINAGLLEKADDFERKLLESSKTGRKWEKIAEVYIQQKVMDRAIPLIKKAIYFAKSRSAPKPKAENVLAVLKYCKDTADVKGTEKIMKLLEDSKCRAILSQLPKKRSESCV